MLSRKSIILLTVVFAFFYSACWIGLSFVLPTAKTNAEASDTSATANNTSSGASSLTSSVINIPSSLSSSEETDVTSSSSSDVTTSENNGIEENDKNENDNSDQTKEITVGMWISMYELNFKGSSESQFKAKIDKMFDNAKNTGVTDLYCHVRPSGDAFYKSDLFPFSHFFGGAQGEYPGYDPLEYMVEAGHKRGLKVHAWVNPYRVASHNDLNKLSDSNIAKIWLTDNDTANDRYVLVERKVKNEGKPNESIAEQLYFNPAIPAVRQYIIDGIKEILEKYDVDGIQIDDYFYPTTEEYFDEVEYNAYKSSVTGTPLSLGDWRRANVNALVSGIYSAVHQYDSVVFGISPASYISTDKSDKNYLEKYADTALWMSKEGYCDYIAPQLYYGYNYPSNDFKFNNLLSKWVSMPKHKDLKIVIGLAPYKIDPNQRPSADGNEWTDDKEILAKQLKDVINAKCNGVALYSYSFVCDNKLSQKHTENFVDALSRV